MRDKSSFIAPWRIGMAKILPNYSLEVSFIDGTKGIVKMAEWIVSDKAGIFSKLKNLDLFNQVYLEHGVVTWPGEIDLAPDRMYEEIKQNGVWIVR